jgi:hypothetical protein
MGKSSIHIQKASAGAVTHNSRENYSKSVVFTDEENELWNDKKIAYQIYRNELKNRIEAYTNRTKQKLQKTAVTHLSAVVNLEQHHTLKDLEKIKDELEKVFDTKVFQIAIHRDEGKIQHKKTGEYLVSGIDFFYNPEDKKYYTKKDKNIYSNELNINEFVIQKNYHAHIEMMGLDSDGQAIRQKMNMYKLSQLQDFTAETLKMQRGNNNVEVVKENGVEKVKRKTTRNKKRLDTHDFKAEKKRENEVEKIVKNAKNKIVKTTAKIVQKEKEEKKKLKEDLEELKKENNLFRTELKEYEAKREDYKKQEDLNKQLQEELKANKIDLATALEQIEDLKKEIFENKKLKEKVTELEFVIQEKEEELDHYGYREKLQENKSLRKEVADLNKALFVKEEENEKLNDEIDYYKSQLKALEQVIDFMKHQNNNKIEYHQENNLTP